MKYQNTGMSGEKTKRNEESKTKYRSTITRDKWVLH